MVQCYSYGLTGLIVIDLIALAACYWVVRLAVRHERQRALDAENAPPGRNWKGP